MNKPTIQTQEQFNEVSSALSKLAEAMKTHQFDVKNIDQKEKTTVHLNLGVCKTSLFKELVQMSNFQNIDHIFVESAYQVFFFNTVDADVKSEGAAEASPV